MSELNPFLLPEIVLPKITLEDVLERLRARLNKSYMPSSTGVVQYNSKPEYLDDRFGAVQVNKQWPDFPNTQLVGMYGTVAYSGRDASPIFAYIGADEIEIVVNLTTEQAIVRHTASDEWILWPLASVGGLGIAMLPFALDQCLNDYL